MYFIRWVLGCSRILIPKKTLGETACRSHCSNNYVTLNVFHRDDDDESDYDHRSPTPTTRKTKKFKAATPKYIKLPLLALKAHMFLIRATGLAKVEVAIPKYIMSSGIMFLAHAAHFGHLGWGDYWWAKVFPSKSYSSVYCL